MATRKTAAQKAEEADKKSAEDKAAAAKTEQEAREKAAAERADATKDVVTPDGASTANTAREEQANQPELEMEDPALSLDPTTIVTHGQPGTSGEFIHPERLDLITPGGTSQGNPTGPAALPEARVEGIVSIGEDGSFRLNITNRPVVIEETPDTKKKANGDALAVFHVTRDLPEGDISAYKQDRARGLIYVMPVDTGNGTYNVAIPANLQDWVGNEKLYVTLVSAKDTTKVVAKSQGFSFGTNPLDPATTVRYVGMTDRGIAEGLER